MRSIWSAARYTKQVGKSGEWIWKGKWIPGQYAVAICLTEDSVVIVAEGF